MNRVIFLAIFFVVMGFNLPRAMGERSELFKEIMRPPAGEADLSIIPPDKLEALKLELRDSAVRGGFNPGPATLLVRLGDPWMIEYLAGKFFIDGHWGSVDACHVAEAAKQPLLIPAFAKYLYYPPDSGGVSGGDVIIPPTVYCAQHLVLVTIRNAPEFSPKLKDWTKAVTYGSGATRRMQLWWEHNQDHFKAAEYDKVEPWPASP